MTYVNVLVVMPLGEFGGGAERMLYTYLSSRREGSSVRLHFVFLSDGSLVKEARNHGYPVVVVEAGRMRDVGRWIRVQRQISKWMGHWGIESVLAWMPKAGVYLSLPARLNGVPMYMWRHDIPDCLSQIDRLVLRLGSLRGVACSSSVAHRAFQACGTRLPSRAIHPAASPMHVDEVQSDHIREQILGGNQGPIVGTVARLQPWKRIDLFLEAASVLKVDCPGLQVVVVGGESHGLSKGYAEEIQQIGRDLLGSSVHFVGEQRNIGDWLQMMDLFVLASQGEPFGIVLVEALAAGKPVIACAGGGPEEIIADGVVGQILHKDPSPVEMASAMLELLTPSALHRAQVQNCVVAKRFSPESMAARIDDWLAEIDGVDTQVRA